MIKKIKQKLAGNQRKSQRPIDIDDRPQSIFFRSVMSPQLSATTCGRLVSSPAPVSVSHNSAETFCPNNQYIPKTQSNSRYFMKVFVPDKFEPGEKINVHVPGGTKVQTCIPPRSEWSFHNCNGEPRPFFLFPVEPAASVLDSLTSIPSIKPSQLAHIPK